MGIVRAATIADLRGIASVDVETWRTTYAGVLPDAFLVQRDERQRAASWKRFLVRRPGDLLVATTQDGEVVGFGSCGVQLDSQFLYDGEVFTLYVLPDFQGQNLGRQLLLGLFTRMLRVGMKSAMLWVVRQNPSRFFYERLGGRFAAVKPFAMGGNFSVETAAYGWTDLSAAVECGARAARRIAGDSTSA